MPNLKDLKNLINKNIIYYFISLVLLLGFGYGKYITEKANEINAKKTAISAIEAELPALETQATTFQLTEQNNKVQETSQNKKLLVEIYTSPYQHVDLENAGYELVDQLMQLFQITGNKISEMSFVNQPVQNNTGILSVDITLSTSYINLKNLLDKIFTWKYLAGLKSIKLEPATDNPNIINTKLTIDLYVKKG